MSIAVGSVNDATKARIPDIDSIPADYQNGVATYHYLGIVEGMDDACSVATCPWTAVWLPPCTSV